MTSTSQDLIQLEKKLLEKQEKIDDKQEQVEKQQEEVAKKREEYLEKLEKISGLTRDEAKRLLLAETEKDAVAQMAKIIKEKEEEAKRTADKKAQEIVVDSL